MAIFRVFIMGKEAKTMYIIYAIIFWISINDKKI